MLSKHDCGLPDDDTHMDEPFYNGTVLRHLKSGGCYVIRDRCRLEATGEIHYLYEPVGGGTLWARSEGEMEDGRFEPVDLSPGSTHHDDQP